MSAYIYSRKAFEKDITKYPFPFNDETIFGNRPCASKYTLAGVGSEKTHSRIHPVMIEAVVKYISAKCMPSHTHFGGTAYTSKKDFLIAEYPAQVINENPFSYAEKHIDEVFDDEERILVAYHLSTGSIRGCYMKSKTSPLTIHPYILSGGKRSGRPSSKEKSSAAILFALLRYAEETSPEVKEQLSNISTLFSILNKDDEDLVAKEDIFASMSILSDLMYRKITNFDTVEASFPGEGISVNLTSANVPTLTTSFILDRDIDQSSIHGGFSAFNCEEYDREDFSPPPVTKSIRIKDARGMYAPTERTLSFNEEMMIPRIDESYQIPEEVHLVGKHIKEITEYRNFLFRGDAGTGKTESVKILAYCMNRPYYFVTCSADTEVYDLTTQVIPDISDENGNVIDLEEILDQLPTTFDIGMDAVGSYELITGTRDESATERDCMMAISKKLMQVLKEKKASFKYVDSPLITAIRNGGVCEIQEPTVIMKPGVLVGLNALFDKTATIQLMTGEKIVRHPDTVIVLTTNSEYEGCRSMNQSVISRMNMVVDFEVPSDQVLADRIMKAADYSDEPTVKKMIAVMHAIVTECDRNGTSDGSVGIRELIDWARSIKITDDPYASALYTIIGSATADSEVRAMLKHCLDSQFSPA